MTLIKDFITTEEEESLFNEVEPHLKRQVYEKDHWDEVSRKNINFRGTKFKCLIKSIKFSRHTRVSFSVLSFAFAADL